MDDIILALQSLLSTALSTTYKKYFYGENRVPAQAHFPFIEIVPLSTSVNVRGTGQMRNNEFAIQINIKDSLKAELTSATDKSIVAFYQRMVKRMEERDSDGVPKAATVLGVLSRDQSDLKLNSKVHINNDWEIEYGLSELGDSWITTATITFTASLLTPN